MAKKKSYVPVAKIKNNLRRLHLHCPQRRKAKDRCKIDAALHKCESEGCKVAVYEGTSEKNFNKLKEKWSYLVLVKGKIEADHEEEVIEPVKGFCDWNTFIERLWCGESNYNMLCSDCHKKRSKKQMEDRKTHGSLKRNKDINE